MAVKRAAMPRDVGEATRSNQKLWNRAVEAIRSNQKQSEAIRSCGAELWKGAPVPALTPRVDTAVVTCEGGRVVVARGDGEARYARKLPDARGLKDAVGALSLSERVGCEAELATLAESRGEDEAGPREEERVREARRHPDDPSAAQRTHHLRTQHELAAAAVLISLAEAELALLVAAACQHAPAGCAEHGVPRAARDVHHTLAVAVESLGRGANAAVASAELPVRIAAESVGDAVLIDNDRVTRAGEDLTHTYATKHTNQSWRTPFILVAQAKLAVAIPAKTEGKSV